jgi:hypothetical protein
MITFHHVYYNSLIRVLMLVFSLLMKHVLFYSGTTFRFEIDLEADVVIRRSDIDPVMFED